MAKEKTKTKEAKDKEEGKKISHPLILGTRITERSSIAADRGVYTFNVVKDANKSEIKKAIKKLYNVTPVKIAIAKIQSKTVVRQGVVGTRAGGKKAIVYLKKGDKIAFV